MFHTSEMQSVLARAVDYFAAAAVAVPETMDNIANTELFDASQKLGLFVDRQELSSKIREILCRKKVV